MPPSLRVGGLILVLALVGGLSAQSAGNRTEPEPPRSETDEGIGTDRPLRPPWQAAEGRPASRPDLADIRTRKASSSPAERTADEPEPVEKRSPREGPAKPGDSKAAAHGDLPPLFPTGRSERGSAAGGPGRSTRPQGLVAVVGSLALVLGLFFVVAWMMRRTMPATRLVLPGEVLEVLGRAPLAGRQQVHLIRLGNKLVLVSVTPAGMEALSEVTDAEEVERLTGLCRQAQPNSSTAIFRQVLQQFSGEHERPRRRGGAAGGPDREDAMEANDV